MTSAALLFALLAAAAPTAPAAPAPAAAKAAAPKGESKAESKSESKADPKIAAVVAKLQERYDSAADYKAKFTQKYTYAATGRERTSTGEILMKKPGRLRWNYQTPEPSLWLATGTTFWMYEPEAKQAVKQDLKASQLPAAAAFLMGKGKLSDEFEISVAKELPYGAPDDVRLSLKPKKPQSTYRSIYFVVDPKTYLVKQSVLINAQGDVNAITFSDMVLNSKLGDDLFRWTPPAGTRVIDGAALGPPTSVPTAAPAPPAAKPAVKK